MKKLRAFIARYVGDLEGDGDDRERHNNQRRRRNQDPDNEVAKRFRDGAPEGIVKRPSCDVTSPATNVETS